MDSPDPPKLSRAADKPLQSMFATVPPRYDLLNRVLTCGFDQRWRDLAVLECLRNQPSRVLDLCTGTGDLALKLANKAQDEVEIVAADFSKPMLQVARHKASTASQRHRINFLLADAAELPFSNAWFDAVGIAFGFRNLTYQNPQKDRYLAELARVIAQGGRCVIVETSQPSTWVARAAFHFYLKALAGPLGGLLSGQKHAYQYLARSASQYHRPNEVSDMLKGAGFCQASFRPLLGGAAAIHVAIR